MESKVRVRVEILTATGDQGFNVECVTDRPLNVAESIRAIVRNAQVDTDLTRYPDMAEAE